MVKKIKTAKKEVKIGLAGKYTDLDDAYLSVLEAIKAASYEQGAKPEIIWIDTESIEKGNKDELKRLKDVDGIVVPGGFGKRGIEGKIEVAKYCRVNKVPYLGLCLGSQIMTMEYARNVTGIKGATSEEFDDQSDAQVIRFLPGQRKGGTKGGTLRLGSQECKVMKGTVAYKCYQSTKIMERHRHRYEIPTTAKKNPFYDQLVQSGLIFSGVSPDGSLAEIIEIPDHPFMVGSQYHAEFLSRPNRAHPLFKGFIKTILKKS